MRIEITRGEWRSSGFIMEWSIPNKEDEKAFEESVDITEKSWVRAWNAVRLDFTAPEGIIDGIYHVYHTKPERDMVHGVVVHNGQFLPVPTEDAILRSLCKTYDITAEDVRSYAEGIDHVFIEKLEWKEEHNAFRVWLGS